VIFTWGTIFVCQLRLRRLSDRGVIPPSPFKAPGYPSPVVTNESVEKAGWFSLAIRSIGNFFSDIWMNAANTVNNWF
jgi:hypothetical protein